MGLAAPMHAGSEFFTTGPPGMSPFVLFFKATKSVLIRYSGRGEFTHGALLPCPTGDFVCPTIQMTLGQRKVMTEVGKKGAGEWVSPSPSISTPLSQQSLVGNGPSLQAI